jgi:hypothetical protein
MSVRLISLNIERDKHLALVEPFLRKERADVIILYELLEENVPLFEVALGAKCFFAPMTRYPTAHEPVLMGVGMFTTLSADFSIAQYAGNPGDIVDFVHEGNPANGIRTAKYLLVRASVENGSETVRILATHFPWTPDGQADDIQRASADTLLALLDTEKEFVLCGDFNAPRGREIFERFAARYKDNVPASYETSLDADRHRVGPKKFRAESMDRYMVDVLFSTPGYAVFDVELRFGVSDHAAVVGTISKN